MSGYVYVLRSEVSRYVKIGRTDQPPMMRLREINATPHYAAVGPWHLTECREVSDSVAEERALHQAFATRRVETVRMATELFDIDLSDALEALQTIPVERCVGGETLKQFRDDGDLRLYLGGVFKATGLENFFDEQEAWTLSIYPSTAGGRYFTLDIPF